MGILSCIAWIVTIFVTIGIVKALWDFIMDDDDIIMTHEIRFIPPKDDEGDEDKSKEKKE